MTEIRSLLVEIAQEMKKDYTVMEKFETILTNEWIDSKDAVNQTSLEELTNLGLPMMLAKKLKNKCEIKNEIDFNKEDDKNGSLNQNGLEILNVSDENVIKETKYDQIKECKDEFKMEDNVELFVSESEILREKKNKSMYKEEVLILKQSIQDDSQLFASISILIKILQNVVNNPNLEKFRLLKRGNSKLEKNIFSLPSVTNLLFILGFENCTNQELINILQDPNLQPAEYNYYMNLQNFNENILEFVIDQLDDIKEELSISLKNKPNPVHPQNNNLNQPQIREEDIQKELQEIKDLKANLENNFKMKPQIYIYNKYSSQNIKSTS